MDTKRRILTKENVKMVSPFKTVKGSAKYKNRFWYTPFLPYRYFNFIFVLRITF